MTEPVSSAGVLGTLGINGKLFIAQLVNVSVILFVVWRWVYRPLLRLMDAREKKIAEGLANADKAKLSLSDAERTREELLRTARLDAHALMETARQEAEEERKRLMAQTQADLERQLEEARDRLKREKDATLDQARKEVAQLVLNVTEKVVPGVVAGDRERALIQQAIAEL
jgi:F-type H+-transporting ATPase subunit b